MGRRKTELDFKLGDTGLHIHPSFDYNVLPNGTGVTTGSIRLKHGKETFWDKITGKSKTVVDIVGQLIERR
jgi:hypothetical protein